MVLLLKLASFGATYATYEIFSSCFKDLEINFQQLYPIDNSAVQGHSTVNFLKHC